MYLALGRYFGEGLNFVLFIMLTRYFGEGKIGQYSFALAIGALIGTIGDYGYSEYAVKALSRKKETAKALLANFVLIRIVLSVFVVMVLLLLAYFMDLDTGARTVLLLIGSYQIVVTFGQIYIAEMKAHEEMRWVTFLELIHRGSILILAFVLILMQVNFEQIMWSYVVGSLLFLGTSIYLSNSHFGPLPFAIDGKEIRRSLREATSFFLTQIL